MKTQTTQNKTVQLAFGVVVLLFFIQFLPYVLGQGFYIRIHDTLEGEWMWFSTLVQNGVAIDFDMETQIESWMGGLPRYLFPPGFSFTILFIYLFGTIGGYVVSSIVIHIVAFLGMYGLLKNYVFQKNEEKQWAILIAALFSIIPFFITFGLTVGGQPLLLLAFLNVLNRRTNYWEYIVVLLFPFYSTIIWSAPFANLMIFVVVIYSYKKEYAIGKMIFLLGVMNVLYLAINYHLVYATFMSDVVLHRDAYNLTLNQQPDFISAIGETFYILFIGNYHVGTFVTLPVFILACFNLNNKTIRNLVFCAFGIAILNGFYLYLVPYLEKIHPFIISFNIKRVKVLLPLIWMGILALSIKSIYISPTGKQLSYVTLFCLILSTLFANDEILNNYRNLLGFQRKPNAQAFFAKETFKSIENYIGEDKTTYRVAHLGFNPTISLHNGFHTIDGLQAMYSLEHKKMMTEIMQAELDKDYKLVRYFEAWGNRCYLFSSELGKENKAFMIGKDQDVEVENWAINTDLMKQQGVDYIFSTVEIGNAADLNIQLINTFENQKEFWKINLYKLL